MSVDLTKKSTQVDLAHGDYAAMRSAIQGNILKPHGREHQRLMVIEFTAAANLVKDWIRNTVVPVVTTGEKQRLDGVSRAANNAFDGGSFTTFHLSADGYRHLQLDVSGFSGKSFRRGMKIQKDGIFDDILEKGNNDPKPNAWEAAYRRPVHALLAIADSSAAKAQAAAAAITASLAGIGTVLVTEAGRVLETADGKKREHFGYEDGISNPTFEGGGQAEWDGGASLNLALVPDPLAPVGAVDALGSYFVFRKLRQDNQSFNDRVAALSTSLAMNPDLAAALAVGRFKDGTPVVGSDHAVGGSPNNNFNFDEDNGGHRCPAHAHIRKANPRGTTPGTSLEEERGRRIVRRGIPYGKPDFAIVDPAWIDPSPAADRGLLFMCYQARIERQFEFIQRTWVDNPNFPKPLIPNPFTKDTGDDPLIGQDSMEGQRWPLKWDDRNAGKKKFNFEAAVTLKGGEYFFAPSLPFLQSL